MPIKVKLKFEILATEFPRVVATADSLFNRLPAENDEDFVHRVVAQQVKEAVFRFERAQSAGTIVLDDDIIVNGE